ncbi:MAG: UPF0262 family protein [Alphaproteobacteria bacterium]|nr:UPF0262 family protein [Alphaproteobacteria bacterium]
MSADTQHIADVTLDERSIVRWSPEIEHERNVAIFDLLETNHFAPVGLPAGPYNLYISIVDGRLRFDVRSTEGDDLSCITLSLSPFRKLIRDYFTVCDSYYAAIKKSASATQIESIDMGRRGLHDEGAELLRERLANQVTIDENTARRLFTLICVLHLRN